MNQYNTYSEIEAHVQISKQFFNLEKRCDLLLDEIHAKKRIDGKKQYTKTVSDIIHVLQALCKHKPCERSPYASLIYYLDEWLFTIAGDAKMFIIEDHQYPLSSVYFSRSDWIGHPPVSLFRMDQNTEFTVHDAIQVHAFLNDYSNMLDALVAYIQTINHSDISKITSKIMKHINKIVNRYLKGMQLMLDIINQDFHKKIEIYFRRKKPQST